VALAETFHLRCASAQKQAWLTSER
jgi:hypothetical protein